MSIRSTRLKIGMEIHVELATAGKMFTRVASAADPANYDAAPNCLVDGYVAALPGTLPVMNRRAIEMSMMVGLALSCRIASFSRWDRKNYFYPDLPKGYQISQYDKPLCEGGHLEITGEDGHARRIGIIRAHLEEDAGKLGHELPGGHHYEGSLVDLNRAGTPLLEIVSEPDIVDAAEAVVFGQELRNLCRFLGVTDGIMQRGQMRFEPNINVIIETEDGREVATPIAEIKNLNSFKALRGSIEHEHVRQVEQWKKDGVTHGPGMKSTRGWDDQRMVTVLQREKEDAHDYRYLPDPDLVPVVVSDQWRDEVAATIPELPMQRRRRYAETWSVPAREAELLTAERDLCFFFEACVKAVDALPPPQAAAQTANWLLNAGSRLANERGLGVHELGITATQLAGLIAMRHDDAIGSSAADTLFALLCETDEPADAVAETHGLLQVRDEGALDAWVDAAIAAQPQAAEDFGAGKDAAAGRLVGHVMKASGGQADAKQVREKLVERLRP